MMMVMIMEQVSSEDSSRDVMSQMARHVTVWEFINMRVNRSLQRPNAKVHVAAMLTELEELHRQYKKLARDELRPVPCDTDQPCPASNILVVSWLVFPFSALNLQGCKNRPASRL